MPALLLDDPASGWNISGLEGAVATGYLPLWEELMRDVSRTSIVTVATGLGWPEGPTVLPDGRIVLVESYRSQLTAIDRKGKASRFAYTAGAPNSCVLGDDGALYVCQNGGTCGPWRAADQTTPSIQRVTEGGKAEILLTEVGGVALN